MQDRVQPTITTLLFIGHCRVHAALPRLVPNNKEWLYECCGEVLIAGDTSVSVVVVTATTAPRWLKLGTPATRRIEVRRFESLAEYSRNFLLSSSVAGSATRARASKTRCKSASCGIELYPMRDENGKERQETGGRRDETLRPSS